MSSANRRAAVAAAVGAAVVALAGVVGGASLPDALAGQTDYVEYAAAARLLLAGDNPYDGAKLLPLQVAVGWDAKKPPDDRRADMMWNPPWVFPLVLLTGAVSWPAGLAGWVTAQLLAVKNAVWLTWQTAGGSVWLAGVVLVAALAFAPTVYLLRVGQVSGFLLLGLAGFAAAMRAGRPALAGAAAALTAIKPHLFLPFAVLLVCDAAVSRATRKAVLAGAVVLGLAAVFPLAWNPAVWSQYVEAVRAPSDAFHHAPGDWDPPILSGKLAAVVGGGLVTQFGPSAAFTVLLVGYRAWARPRRGWDWPRELPAVVLGSYLTTGYGAWAFDAVVLLLPVVQAAAWVVNARNPRLQLWTACGYLALTAAMFAGMLPLLWWAPAVAVGYGLLALLTRPSGPPRTGPAPASRG